MPVHAFRWAQPVLRYSINGNVDFDRGLILAAVDRWRALIDRDMVEVPPGSPSEIIVARLDEVQAAFPGHSDTAGLAVVITDGAVARVAYVGLQRGTSNDARVAVHELAHALGLADDYPADPSITVMSASLAGQASRPEARDIAEIQAVYGPSPRNDIIHGGAGSGPIAGGPGADVIYGNQGADILYGNQDSDTLYGGQDDDAVYGGQGGDLIYGNRGSDVLYGNLGDDTLYGGQGDDRIYGGQGDDVILPGLGTDRVWGGLGTDRVIYSGAATIAGNTVSGPGFHHILDGVEIVVINGVEHRIA